MLRDGGIFRGAARGTGRSSKPVIPPMVSGSLITTPGSDRRAVPSNYDATHVLIELWGSGATGSGWTLSTSTPNAGGGGGGYGKKLLAVTPGQVIPYTVGAGPVGVVSNGGVAGNASSCSGMTANGGNAPTGTNGNVGGTGGSVTGSDSFGSGSSGTSSGLGAGQGGSSINGGDYAASTASSPSNGTPGNAPGGGGSGSRGSGTAGGNGANGGIRFTRPPDMVDGEVFTTNGFQARTVPAGVTSITIEIWGPGASGSNTLASGTGKGGGAGGYCKRNTKSVTPGDVISFFIGRGASAQSTANSNGVSATQDTTCDGMTAEGGVGGNNVTGGGGGASGGDVNTSGTVTTTANGANAPVNGGGVRGLGGANPTSGTAPGTGGGAKSSGTGPSGAGANGGIRFTF